jgi:arylsulfatase
MPAMMRGRLAGMAAGFFVALALTTAGCGPREKPAPQSDTNVLLITLDALRQDHLSFNGYERETSPNIDWLAQRGLVFSDMVPTGCSTKASLTSLYVSQGYRHHQIMRHGGVLSEHFLTLAEAFWERGYDTAGFVATPHMLAEMHYDQGFDRYEDFSSRRTEAAAEYLSADQVVDATLDYLTQRPDGRPFFAYLHLEEPHPPWVHGSPWLEHEEPAELFFKCTEVPTDEQLAAVDEVKRHDLIAKYDGAIRYADEQIGRLLDELRRRGTLDRTIVAVSTDHGLELLERFSATHGLNPFDEVVKTFLVIYDPTHDSPAADTAVQGRIFDIGPTLMALAGLTIPDAFEGVDLIGHPEALPEFAFTQCYNGEIVRTPAFKLVRITEAQQGSQLASKFVPEGLRLYDLVRDPGETTDVQALQPEQFRRMQLALEGYLADLGKEYEFSEELSDEELSDEALERLRSLGYVQ